jgi:hypothetical protein
VIRARLHPVIALAAALAACDAPAHRAAPAPVVHERPLPVVVCDPGTTRACYDGPPETFGIGACRAGTKTCDATGTAYGPCAGEVLPGTPSCDGAEDVACDGAPGCHGRPIWSVAFPSAGATFAFDTAGDTAIAFGGNFEPPTVQKLAPDGSTRWTWTAPNDVAYEVPLVGVGPTGDVAMVAAFNGSAIDLGMGLETFPDGDYTLVLVLDAATGKLRWHYIAAAFWSNGVMVGPAGDVTLLGNGDEDVDGSVLAVPGTAVAHFDPAGAHTWTKSFGILQVQSVTAAPDGSTILDGNSSVAVSFGDLTIGGGDVPVTYLAAVDPGGSPAWAQLAGLTVTESIAAGGGDRLARAGIYSDPTGSAPTPGDLGGGRTCPVPSGSGAGLFVAGHDLKGDGLWARCLLGDASTTIASPAVGPSGEVAIGGTFVGTGPIDLGGGPLLVTPGVDILDYLYAGLYDASGALLWSRRLGAAVDASLLAIGVAGAGDVLVAGTFTGTLDLGAGPLTADPNGSIFVARLAR